MSVLIRTVLHFKRLLFPAVVFVLAVFAGIAIDAQTGAGSANAFNHTTTGFVLEGAHLRERCESCHTQGTFRGTPKDCASCHRQGGRAPGKTASHIQTTVNCDSCHLSVIWSPSSFRHLSSQGVMQGACSTCHGASLPGKPLTHVVTTASCDSCHKTSAWLPAGYDHALAAPGACATCHNGVRATGKKPSHIPTTASCDVCHAPGVTFSAITSSVSAMHSNMTGPAAIGNCSTCHNGTFLSQNAQTKPATHIPTTAQCDTCHRSTSSFATVTFDHMAASTPVAGRCTDCHGVSALGKPSTHIPTTQQCDTCHTNFIGFKPALMNHVGTAGQCATCHSGSFNFANANPKPASHIPTTNQCDTCHISGFIAWPPATMNHTGTAGKCITCHSGGFIAQNAQTKPAKHVATTAQCDTCHNSTSTWATAVYNHAAASPPVAGRCSNCHNGTDAVGKPVTHIPTAAQCDTCHTNTTNFKPAQMNHAGTTGQCSTCHNGSFVAVNALSRPIGHIPTTKQCDTCHVSGFVAFLPVTMNHAGLAGQCSACHSGTYLAQNAQTKPVTHIATKAQCDTCHNSTTSWATATFAHDASTVGTCSTCHNGVKALGKPTIHIPTSAQCDTCHTNTITFKPAVMSHPGTTGPVAMGSCSTCHNGSYTAVNALAKPVNHIPTINQCDTCHTKGYIAWSPSVMNHTGLAGQCSTCHSGAYLLQNAQSKPTTHTPTTAQCDTCHNSTTTWATATFNHPAATPPVAGRCATCHNSVAALGKPVNHIPTTAQCDVCHTTGFVAFAPGVMSHSGTTGPVAAGNCVTCHSGAFVAVNAQVKPAKHIPTAQSCDTCHGTTAWKPTTFAHTGVVKGTCATCHNGTLALGKTTTHIPTTASCDVCHTNYSTFAPATMSHAGTSGPLAVGNCSTCHSGAYLTINAQVKTATHIATTAQCDTCHNSTTSWATATFAHDASTIGTCSTCHNGTKALGKPTTHIPTSAQCDSCHTNTTVFKPAVMSHTGTTGPVAVGNCSTCHGGGYTSVNALTKPTTHIPTAKQCDFCHTKGYVTWSPSVMNHTGLAGQCSTCHSGAYLAQNAQVKSATHTPTTAQCDTCHTSTTSWATATFDHTKANPPVTGRCSTCHNGTLALGKPTNHIPTTSQCDVCHTTGFKAFAPGVMSHSGTAGPVAAGNCATCHSGAYTAINAQAKSTTHLPTTQSCDICHTTTAWKPTNFSHTGILPGTCTTCHNGVIAVGKIAAHIPTAQSCDVCHRMGISWLPVITPYAHAGAVPGACATCHTPAFANIDVKTAAHLPTLAACDACHHSYVAWLPITYNHTGVATGTCQTCHSGTYLNIMAKPTNHIPTTTPAGMPGNECSLCHSSTITFATEKMNHGTMQTSCATCHSSTATYLGGMTKITIGKHQNSKAGNDCSMSGCHRPLGTIGTTYTKWN